MKLKMIIALVQVALFMLSIIICFLGVKPVLRRMVSKTSPPESARVVANRAPPENVDAVATTVASLLVKRSF